MSSNDRGSKGALKGFQTGFGLWFVLALLALAVALFF
jgi:hypothetical protein